MVEMMIEKKVAIEEVEVAIEEVIEKKVDTVEVEVATEEVTTPEMIETIEKI